MGFTRWEWAGLIKGHFPFLVLPRLTDEQISGGHDNQRLAAVALWLAADWPLITVHYHEARGRTSVGSQKARCSALPSFWWFVCHCVQIIRNVSIFEICARKVIFIYYLSIIYYLSQMGFNCWSMCLYLIDFCCVVVSLRDRAMHRVAYLSLAYVSVKEGR